MLLVYSRVPEYGANSFSVIDSTNLAALLFAPIRTSVKIVPTGFVILILLLEESHTATIALNVAVAREDP